MDIRPIQDELKNMLEKERYYSVRLFIREAMSELENGNTHECSMHLGMAFADVRDEKIYSIVKQLDNRIEY